MDMMTIWKTVIKSKLDNCSQLWSPSDQSLIQKLDSSVSSLEKMERSPEQDSIPDSKLIYTTLHYLQDFQELSATLKSSTCNYLT